jgi:hypothetical protein
MNRTNTRGKAISHKRRQLTGQVVDMAMALFDHSANLDDRASCRHALLREGYPQRTIEIMLDVVIDLARKVHVERS